MWLLPECSQSTDHISFTLQLQTSFAKIKHFCKWFILNVTTALVSKFIKNTLDSTVNFRKAFNATDLQGLQSTLAKMYMLVRNDKCR